MGYLVHSWVRWPQISAKWRRASLTCDYNIEESSWIDLRIFFFLKFLHHRISLAKRKENWKACSLSSLKSFLPISKKVLWNSESIIKYANFFGNIIILKIKSPSCARKLLIQIGFQDLKLECEKKVVKWGSPIKNNCDFFLYKIVTNVIWLRQLFM